MSKKLRITCSNFDNIKKDYIQGLIKKIGGICDDHLEFDTDILIAANSLSIKHRSASILGIPIVTSKWIYKSIEAERFLDPNDYLLPYFTDLKFGVLGFNSYELEEIRTFIEKNEGKIIVNINEIIKNESLHLIILNFSELKTYESFLISKNIMVVNENWLRCCKDAQTYVRPESFLIEIKNSDSNYNLKEMYHCEMQMIQKDLKLKKITNSIEISDEHYLFFSDLIFFFHNISEAFEKTLKELINIGGGLYFHTLTPKTTHIITESYTNNDLGLFKSISTNFFIINPLWLKDCYKYKKKVHEIEYFIKINQNLSFSMTNININNNNFSNAFSVRSNKRALSSAHEKGKESIKNDKMKTPRKSSPIKKLITPSKKEIQIHIKSFLFQNVFFHINLNDNKELKNYRIKILENSGKITDSLTLKNNIKLIFYVLTDKPESLAIKRQVSNNIICVSFRWIDYCIEKKQVLKNFMELKLIHLSPFAFKMPIPTFKNLICYVCGFPTHEKIVLKSILNVLGATVTYDKEKINFLICENNESKKYLEILEIKQINKKKINIVKAEWIFECLTHGKIVDSTQFLFN